VIRVDVGGVTIFREMTIGGGHAGGQLGWIPFGLGPADSAVVRVTWPDGTSTGPLAVAADQRGTIVRADGAFLPWAEGG
jgi:hypothetical protein